MLVIGCDSMLDIEPETKTTYTNYFKGEKDAAALLYNANAKLFSVLGQDKYHEVVGLKVDMIRSQSYIDVRDLDPTAYNVSWSIYYSTIYSANVILDNAYRFTDIENERLEYYKCQACFIKGVCYFLLARQWGDVPIVPNSTVVAAFPREEVNKVLEEAIRNAEIALDLPKFEDLVDETGGKIYAKQYGSKGAATALLAQIYAWRGGLFGDKDDWEKAEQYCSEIIDGKVGYYELVDTPQNVCAKVMKGDSPEGIFEGEYSMLDDPFHFHDAYAAVEPFIGYPVIENSLPTEERTFEINRTTVKDMYEEGDRRMDAYFFKIDSVYKYPSGEEIPITKAFLQKWNFPVYEYSEWDEAYEYKNQNVNRVVWRLADIMLLRAECRARLNKANAADDLNEIRKRAYGDYSHNYTASEGDLRYVIFKEREKELLFEGHRFYDVLRNGYWKTELTEAYAIMSDGEFDLGAQYYPVEEKAFYQNDLMRQNLYWSAKGIK